MLKVTFSKIFRPALITSPCCIKMTLSIENVENVVSAPRNPSPIIGRQGAASIMPWLREDINTPIIREPTILTVKVPYGKPLPNRTTQSSEIK